MYVPEMSIGSLASSLAQREYVWGASARLVRFPIYHECHFRQQVGWGTWLVQGWHQPGWLANPCHSLPSPLFCYKWSAMIIDKDPSWRMLEYVLLATKEDNTKLFRVGWPVICETSDVSTWSMVSLVTHSCILPTESVLHRMQKRVRKENCVVLRHILIGSATWSLLLLPLSWLQLQFSRHIRKRFRDRACSVSSAQTERKK